MQIVIRAVVLYAFVYLVLRAVGRKELSELSSFELVILIVLGDLIQQGVTGDDRSITGAALAVATFALLTVALSYTSFRFKRLRPALDGEPAIVVLHGKVQHKLLATQRVDEDDLKEAAREQGIADIGEIEVGVLEADGRFSFLRDDRERPPVREEVE
jgi:uncharacterized membrane protein YcaP (DUF421 family)